MNLDIKDENSIYLGDGAYGHIDSHGRLWVVTYDGISVTNQICLEDSAIKSLIHLRNRVNNVYIGNNPAKHYAEAGDVYGWDLESKLGWITPMKSNEPELEGGLE